MQLVEPLRPFFKDEVRELGVLLGIDSEILHQHPFPGPGLAIRCIGELRRERIEILRRADEIFTKNWSVATCISGLGRRLLHFAGAHRRCDGDQRSYEHALAIRAVSSVDAMTAEVTEFSLAELLPIASRLINEVRGINRVVYDLTSKAAGDD